VSASLSGGVSGSKRVDNGKQQQQQSHQQPLWYKIIIPLVGVSGVALSGYVCGTYGRGKWGQGDNTTQTLHDSHACFSFSWSLILSHGSRVLQPN